MGQDTNIKNRGPIFQGSSTQWKKMIVEFFEKYIGGEVNFMLYKSMLKLHLSIFLLVKSLKFPYNKGYLTKNQSFKNYKIKGSFL